MSGFSPLEMPITSIDALPFIQPGRPVGRDDILRQVYAVVRENRAIWISGNKGSGKTSIAGFLASAYIQQGSEVLWLSVNETSFSELLVRVGRAYQLENVTSAKDPTAHIGAVASALRMNKPFIVIDGKVDVRAVTEFINKCARDLPVVVATEAEAAGDWQSVHLEALDEANAVILFKQKAGIGHNQDDGDIIDIVTMLAKDPFAIIIAARTMLASKQSPSDYDITLRQIQLTNPNDPQKVAITASYRALNNGLQGLLLMLGASFTAQASDEVLSLMSNLPAQTIEQAMTILSQLCLVEKHTRQEHNIYRLHPSVASFALQQLANSNRLSSLQEKFQDTIQNFVKAKTAIGPSGYEGLALEMENIRSTAKWAREEGSPDVASRLIVHLTQDTDFVNECGYVYELMSLQPSTTKAESKAFPAYGEEIPSPESLMSGFNEDEFDDEYSDEFDDDDDYSDEFDDDLSDDLDEFDRPAPYAGAAAPEGSTGPLSSLENVQQALQKAREGKDFTRQQQLLQTLAKLQVDQDKSTEAITSYNELIDLYEMVNDADGLMETLAHLSTLLINNDEDQAAIVHAKRGLELAEGGNQQRLTFLRLLGNAYENLGNAESAIPYYQQGLSVAQDIGNQKDEALIRYHLGYTHLDDGNADDAVKMLEAARNLFKLQENRMYEGRVLGALGSANAELERWAESISYHKSAVHIAREIQDYDEERLELSNLAQVCIDAEKLPEALLYYRQALHVAYEHGTHGDIVNAVVDLVELMLRSRRLLNISQLLVEDALQYGPEDKELRALKQTVTAELDDALAAGINLSPVNGSAKMYARNAYEQG